MTFRTEQLADGKVTLHCGDCLDVFGTLEANSIDACVTDPPYGLGFMGKAWDRIGDRSANFTNLDRPHLSQSKFPMNKSRGRPIAETDGPAQQRWHEAWAREVFRVLKPGGHLLSFGGTRTFHRMACAIEDAGFEIRDMISWLYGSGFPKSLDVAKALDKSEGGVWRGRVTRALPDQSVAKGVEYERVDKGDPITDAAREWSGFGTALKPACEPIVLARKPLEGTVAQNVLKWGVGALNIDGCRVATDPNIDDPRLGGAGAWTTTQAQSGDTVSLPRGTVASSALGRWPANVILSDDPEVQGAFPDVSKSPPIGAIGGGSAKHSIYGDFAGERHENGYGDSGSAARFFYTAKADADDRLGSRHPTVKPLDLMQYLVRLVCPPKGLCLDPFAGTGTTGEACIREGFRAILIERELEYQEDIRRRMRLAMCGPSEREREAMKARMKDKPIDAGPLFGGTAEAMGGGA